MCNKQLLLFLLFVVILYQMDRTTVDKRVVIARAIFIALLYFVLHQIILMNEGFFFQVTDWKKTCGQNRDERCAECCAPGFNGQNVCFDYTGDHERMAMQQAGCSCPKQSFPKNNPNNYVSLGQGCKEEYRRGDFIHLANTSPCNQQSSVTACSANEGYCNTTHEGYQYRKSNHIELGTVKPCNQPNTTIACKEEYCGTCG